MIYNEYAQVLETTNPATGELYKPEDLNIFNWNDYRSSMLQDAIFAREAWLKEGNNRDVAVRFVRASLKGWMYCRDNPADCVQYTLDAGSQLGAGHQAWQMNEINASRLAVSRAASASSTRSAGTRRSRSPRAPRSSSRIRPPPRTTPRSSPRP